MHKEFVALHLKPETNGTNKAQLAGVLLTENSIIQNEYSLKLALCNAKQAQIPVESEHGATRTGLDNQ